MMMMMFRRCNGIIAYLVAADRNVPVDIVVVVAVFSVVALAVTFAVVGGRPWLLPHHEGNGRQEEV